MVRTVLCRIGIYSKKRENIYMYAIVLTISFTISISDEYILIFSGSGRRRSWGLKNSPGGIGCLGAVSA